MLKFIAVSFIVMVTGCIVVDKIEEFLNERNKYDEEKEQDQYIDTDTLDILKNYGLINVEQLKM
ncbi:hypothetical protein [uncultured Clostridium sp.]|uniref:hypothetical protein n=1 Tax=uncultured Clostridium sp. TaxID=59620 RepID=UPI0025D84DB2|nr:hypothetical protein [uncultured Clostridium sp.]